MPWLGAVGLLVLALAPRDAEARSKPDTVALSFGWKPGMHVSATSSSKRTRIIGERTERATTVHYKMRVDPDTAGLRIRFEGVTFDPDDAKPPTSSAVAARIVEQMAGLMPDFVVARDGAFKRIHDIPAYQARFRSLMMSLSSDKADTTALQRAQAMLTSEPFLNSMVSERWNAVVGAWLAAELELGESYGYSSREPIALFPGQEVQMNYTFAVKRRLSCGGDAAERRCVELEMRSVADPEDTKRMLARFFEKFVDKSVTEVATPRTLEIENVILLVTEPNGLIPHRLTTTKTVKGTMSLDGKAVPIEQVDVTQTEYAYP